jgi:hypothetical protein
VALADHQFGQWRIEQAKRWPRADGVFRTDACISVFGGRRFTAYEKIFLPGPIAGERGQCRCRLMWSRVNSN